MEAPSEGDRRLGSRERNRAPGREPPNLLTPERSAYTLPRRSNDQTWGEAMKDLRDWYQYLEGISRGSAPTALPSSPIAPPVAPGHLTDTVDVRKSFLKTSRAVLGQTPGRSHGHQGRLPIDLGDPGRLKRKPGRPPLTESREEVIRRVLDPELTLHETSALLNLSKATVRRYTDQGRLHCTRTAGGQRRFQLSEVLAFLEQRRPVEATS